MFENSSTYQFQKGNKQNYTVIHVYKLIQWPDALIKIFIQGKICTCYQETEIDINTIPSISETSPINKQCRWKDVRKPTHRYTDVNYDIL